MRFHSMNCPSETAPAILFLPSTWIRGTILWPWPQMNHFVEDKITDNIAKTSPEHWATTVWTHKDLYCGFPAMKSMDFDAYFYTQQK